MSATYQEIAYAAERALGERQDGDELTPEQVLHRANVDDPSPTLIEWTEQLLRDELAAPAAQFRAAYDESGGDLRRMAERFPEASAAVLARRFLLWDLPTVVTIHEGGRTAFRQGNCQHTDRLTPLEVKALEALRGKGGHRLPRRPRPVDLHCEALRVQAWPLTDIGGWDTIVLRLTIEN